MSLFSRLINVYKRKLTEDFFTEVIAYFFSKNKHILIEWLDNELKTDYSNRNIEVYISTQITYDSLDTHDRDSRPDILIEINYNNQKEVILIESKVGSKEGNNQLKNYSDILLAMPNIEKRYLIYITRNYEEKNKSQITNNNDNIIFHQTRWYRLFMLINKKYQNSPLALEVLTFMKEIGMASSNKFSPTDLLAMSGFKRVAYIMDKSLKEKAKKKFIKLFGSACQDSSSLTQYINQGRYIIHRSKEPWNFWCGIGYFRTNLDEELFNIGVTIEVNPNYAHRQKVIEMMKDACQEMPDIWIPSQLGNSKAWSRINYQKSIESILSQEDHIFSAENFFLECLDKVDYLKNKSNHLDW